MGRSQASVPFALPAAPGAGGLVPPQAVAEVQDFAPVRPAASLALALGTAEPDRQRQLASVDRVEPAVAGEDGQGAKRLYRRLLAFRPGRDALDAQQGVRLANNLTTAPDSLDLYARYSVYIDHLTIEACEIIAD